MKPYRDHLADMRAIKVRELIAKEGKPMLELWEIIVPTRANNGNSYKDARKQWEAHLLECFGGYSANAIQGAWRDPADGYVYTELNVSYRFLADGEPSLERAFELFPDQIAFYIARIGQGEIRERV